MSKSSIYSLVHKYLEKDTVLMILPQYITMIDLKQMHQDVFEM